MSHFTMLVATPSRPDEAMLDKIMAPWHEFECTGIDDEYVQDVDETEEARKTYSTQTARRMRDAQGVYHKPWLDCFYRELTPEEIEAGGRKPLDLIGSGSITMPDGSRVRYQSQDWNDGKGYRAKVQYIPPGYEEVEVLVSEVESFAEWVEGWYGTKTLAHGDKPTDEHKYGYTMLDEAGEVVKVIKRTNPNSQWDWYVVGGRWSGLLQLKHPELDGAVGRPGVMNTTSERGGVDSCCVNDLDLVRMCQENIDERKSMVDIGVRKVLEKNPVLTRDEIIRMAERRARAVASLTEVWEAADRPVRLWDWMKEQTSAEASAVRETEDVEPIFDYFGGGLQYNSVTDGIEKWVQSADALMTYGFVTLDGKWCSRGDMGWFGMSLNEQDEDVYRKAQKDFFKSLPRDAWLTVVDCHT